MNLCVGYSASNPLKVSHSKLLVRRLLELSTALSFVKHCEDLIFIIEQGIRGYLIFWLTIVRIIDMEKNVKWRLRCILT